MFCRKDGDINMNKKKRIWFICIFTIVAFAIVSMGNSEHIEKTVGVNVCKGGKVTDTSTIVISGNIKTSILRLERSFVGTFAMGCYERSCRDGVEAKIEWHDGYQSIGFFHAGDFTLFDVEKIRINKLMDSIAVYLSDGTVIATPDIDIRAIKNRTECSVRFFV